MHDDAGEVACDQQSSHSCAARLQNLQCDGFDQLQLVTRQAPKHRQSLRRRFDIEVRLQVALTRGQDVEALVSAVTAAIR